MGNDTEITGLDELFSEINQLMLTENEKANIVAVGAEEFVNQLKPEVPFDEEKVNKKKHLRDRITFKKGQYGDGSTDVGFDKKGYYYRFVNNGHRVDLSEANHGTKMVQGKHFMEHTVEKSKGKVFQAMKNEFNKKRGG